MIKNFENHPCFYDKTRHKYGRIHLPVAPRCNIQCNFCNRKFDCVNESRPGVTSTILTPKEAACYVNEIVKKNDNISVVGIAGPGDPFANPDETMETLRLINKNFPEMLLCVSSNGLYINPYIEELAELNVSHITLTINAVDPVIGAKIYSWIRYEKRIRGNIEGAQILLEKQLEAIRKLKKRGIVVKVNSIIIPGINDHHIVDIAEKLSEFDVDILNCIPFYNSRESNFKDIEEPDLKLVTAIRKEAGKFIKQMYHCKRCRADAVGFLGKEMKTENYNELQKAKKIYLDNEYVFIENKPNIAVGSNEGLLINNHLGEAFDFIIYEKIVDGVQIVGKRRAPEKGNGDERWEELAKVLNDCSYILVNGVGKKPEKILNDNGINIVLMEGLIDEAVEGIFFNKSVKHLLKRAETICGQACSGNGGGCG